MNINTTFKHSTKSHTRWRYKLIYTNWRRSQCKHFFSWRWNLSQHLIIYKKKHSWCTEMTQPKVVSIQTQVNLFVCLFGLTLSSFLVKITVTITIATHITISVKTIALRFSLSLIFTSEWVEVVMNKVQFLDICTLRN